MPSSITARATASPERASRVNARASSPPAQPRARAAATRAGPRAYISVQPCPPQTHRGPQALTLMWPRCTALPVRPAKSLLSITAPPPTPVESTTPTIEATSRPAPSQCSPRAKQCPSPASPTPAGVRSVRLGQTAATRADDREAPPGTDVHRRDGAGGPVDGPGRGDADPEPVAVGSEPGASAAMPAEQRGEHHLGVGGAAVGRRWSVRTVPSASTAAARSWCHRCRSPARPRPSGSSCCACRPGPGRRASRA